MSFRLVKSYLLNQIKDISKLIIILLVLLMISVSFLPSIPQPRILITIIPISSSGDLSNSRYEVIINALGDLGSITVNIGSHMDSPSDIFIYYNNSSSGTAISYDSIVNEKFSLSQYLEQRDKFTVGIKIINSTGLAKLVTSSTKGLLLIPTGNIPAAVIGSKNDSLISWITNGGFVSWIGSPPPAGILGYSMTGLTPQDNNFSEDKISSESTFAREYDIPLLMTLDSLYANVSSVESHGGFVLGHFTLGKFNGTDLALQPIGKGGLLYSPTNLASYYSNEFAWTIIQVFYSGISPLSKLITSISIKVQTSAFFSLTVNLPETGLRVFSVYAFQNVPISSVIYRLAFVQTNATYNG